MLLIIDHNDIIARRQPFHISLIKLAVYFTGSDDHSFIIVDMKVGLRGRLQDLNAELIGNGIGENGDLAYKILCVGDRFSAGSSGLTGRTAAFFTGICCRVFAIVITLDAVAGVVIIVPDTTFAGLEKAGMISRIMQLKKKRRFISGFLNSQSLLVVFCFG